eukprot:TRINITY_DN15351_c0_g1_i1.p2 TRINITY_DN15351_c0_g1~~TRINITY_DN15351_c0_g1_i1.p2  ORF type:complete len:130 (+),score=42.70 TRINITY_DN15351_c0_g1_i1:910-1299(+)
MQVEGHHVVVVVAQVPLQTQGVVLVLYDAQSLQFLSYLPTSLAVPLPFDCVFAAVQPATLLAVNNLGYLYQYTVSLSAATYVAYLVEGHPVQWVLDDGSGGAFAAAVFGEDQVSIGWLDLYVPTSTAAN